MIDRLDAVAEELFLSDAAYSRILGALFPDEFLHGLPQPESATREAPGSAERQAEYRRRVSKKKAIHREGDLTMAGMSDRWGILVRGFVKGGFPQVTGLKRHTHRDDDDDDDDEFSMD